MPIKPRTLLFDIENTPIEGRFWDMYETNPVEVTRYSHMLSFAYQWLGEGGVKVRALPDYPLYKIDPRNDKALVEELHSLISQAQVVVAHNGTNFDLRVAKTRFIYHGMPPPPPYKIVDTCAAAKRYFRFHSNKLNDLLVFFGYPPKVSTGGYALWPKCIQGDEEAWRLMRRYNKYDVTGLRLVYLRMRPYILNHPNFNLFVKDIVCPYCQSPNIWREGIIYKETAAYQQFSCRNCGAWSRALTNVKVKTRDSILKA